MGTDRYRELPRSVQPHVEIQRFGRFPVRAERYWPQAERAADSRYLRVSLTTNMLSVGFDLDRVKVLAVGVDLDQVKAVVGDPAVGTRRHLRDFFAATAIAKSAERALDLVLVDEHHVSLVQAKHHFLHELAHEGFHAGFRPREFGPTVVLEPEEFLSARNRTLARLLERVGGWRSSRDVAQRLRDLRDEARRMAAVAAALCSTGLRSYLYVEAAPPTACSPCGVVGLRVPIVPRAPGLRSELCPAHGTCVPDRARPEYALAA